METSYTTNRDWAGKLIQYLPLTASILSLGLLLTVFKIAQDYNEMVIQAEGEHRVLKQRLNELSQKVEIISKAKIEKDTAVKNSFTRQYFDTYWFLVHAQAKIEQRKEKGQPYESFLPAINNLKYKLNSLEGILGTKQADAIKRNVHNVIKQIMENNGGVYYYDGSEYDEGIMLRSSL